MSSVSQKRFTQEDLQFAQNHLTYTIEQLNKRQEKYERYQSDAEARYLENAQNNYKRAVETVEMISKALFGSKQ